MRLKSWLSGLLVFICVISPALCGAGAGNFILMASTIAPIDSGIVPALEAEFEKETEIRVRHVGAGTGAALEIAKKGNIDLVLVHAKALEEKFVEEGYGTERIALMYNDFVIVGPEGDQAGVKGMKSVREALRQIAAKDAPFVSRGDKSGTHIAEMGLWEKAGLKPAGSWYSVYEKGTEGNVPTLRYTDRKKAYTVIDRATYLALRKEISLVILVEGDAAMLNYMSLIPVNPRKFSRVNYEDAMTFVKWLTAPDKGQRIIRDFGRAQYGDPLFFPNSKEWRQTHE